MKISMRSRYKVLNPDGIYFITSSIVNWIPVFTSDKYYSIIIENLKFYQKNEGLKIFAYVLLNNHFHLIVSCKELIKMMQSFKKFTAKEIINNLKEDGKTNLLLKFHQLKKSYKTTSSHQIWQEGYFPKEMISIIELRQKIDYMHLNPIRKGYVKNPEDWVYSSATDYLTNRKGLIELDINLLG